MKVWIIAALALVWSGAALADEARMTKASPHDVQTTMDRLQSAVEAAGATVMARVDHADGAASVDMELPAAQLLVFGNPKVGTPLMQQNIALALTLPMRVAVIEDGDGQTQVIYPDMKAVAEAHGLEPESEAVTKVAGALEKLTDAAIAEE